jgi:shikimate dehydrogenase
MKYGLIGEKLGHSFSKEIHEMIGYYKYEIHEVAKEDIESFMKEKDFLGINVTIPYKETVIPYLDEISPQALSIGAVNTIVNENGKLYGHNTDYFGMLALIKKNNIDCKDKKVLILGTGGTSKTASVLLKDLGAKEIYFASTRKSDMPNVCSYEDAVSLHNDCSLILNTTPCGMFPNNDDCIIDLSRFNNLEAVCDVIYNPLRTNLIIEAIDKNVK